MYLNRCLSEKKEVQSNLILEQNRLKSVMESLIKEKKYQYFLTNLLNLNLFIKYN